MLQLAWVTKSTEFEIRAYWGLAKQHYYEQNIEKCQFYLIKAMCGEIEPDNTVQHITAID